MNPGKVAVEVVFALPGRQLLRRLEVDPGCTVREAIEASGIGAEFPDFDLEKCRVGIYGKLVSPERVLNENDRVEILRALALDPKEARRKRARAKPRR